MIHNVSKFLEALFDTSNPSTVAGQVKEHAAILKQYATDRNSALVLMGCFEELLGVIEPRLLPRTPIILQALYESEVLDEETILAWHISPPESSFMVNKKVAMDVRKKATKFVEWLKAAEEVDE